MRFFLRFFCHIFCMVCRVVTILFTEQSADMLKKPLKHLEHVREVHGKFSRDLWKNLQMQRKMRLKYFVKTVKILDFELKIFLERFLENVLSTLRICSIYLIGGINILNCF